MCPPEFHTDQSRYGRVMALCNFSLYRIYRENFLLSHLLRNYQPINYNFGIYVLGTYHNPMDPIRGHWGRVTKNRVFTKMSISRLFLHQSTTNLVFMYLAPIATIQIQFGFTGVMLLKIDLLISFLLLDISTSNLVWGCFT